MPAIIEIREKNTAGEAPTTKTSSTIRMKNADDANVDLNDPIVRPGAGSVFGYPKALRLFMGATGPSGSITNPRVFSDGANGFGTGITMKAAITTGVAGAGYQDPGGIGANDMDTPLSVAAVDFFTYTAGSPLAINAFDTGGWDGSFINSDIADYVWLQTEVASTASPGLTSAETATFSYDES